MKNEIVKKISEIMNRIGYIPVNSEGCYKKQDNTIQVFAEETISIFPESSVKSYSLTFYFYMPMKTVTVGFYKPTVDIVDILKEEFNI